jgi:cyanate permease
MGAEGDIVPYLVSRYFGLRAFGEIFGYAFTAFVLGAVIGPLLMGVSFDFTGSYGLVLGLFTASTLAATWLMTRLGSYPDWDVGTQPA